MKTVCSGLLLLCCMMSGCGGDILSSGARGGVEVDSSVYHVTTGDTWAEVTIPVTFTNPLFADVRIPACHSPYPPIIEKLTDSGWVVAFNPTVLLCITPPVRVRAGDSYRMLYHVVAGRAPNTGPRFHVDEIAGTYRLNWVALLGPSGELAPEHRISAPFELIERMPSR